MKTTFLFPAPLRKVGWLLFIPSLLAVVLLQIFEYEQDITVWVPALANHDIFGEPEVFAMIENNITDEILFSMIIIGGILAGFSKLRAEDEFTALLRYESLVYATYANFAVMLVATLTVYGTFYLNVLIANVFTLLFFFLARFQYKLYQLKKMQGDDQ